MTLRRIKLRPPALPPDLVARPALEARLDRAATLPLTLVVARAGFGKTTLLASWLRSAALPVAWLALDPGDGDLRRFALHLVAALRQAAPDAAPSIDALLAGARELDPETVAAVLADDLLDLPAPVALVVDDLHAVERPEPAALLGAMLRHWPPQLRLVVSSRRVPDDLGADRMVARGFATVLDETDLRFGAAETAALLGDDAAGAALVRTEGWPAGVRALALAGEMGAGSVGAALAADVLSGQPADLVAFLRRIAVAERVNPGLAAALCGDGTDDARAAALLAEADRRGLFVSRLDGDWWGIHPLLRDMLVEDLARTDEDALRDAHARASRWLAEAGMIDEAIDHAGRAGSSERVADLLVGLLPQWLESGQDLGFAWIDRMAPQLVAGRPALLVARAYSLMNQGNLSAAASALDDAQRLLADEDAEALLPETRLLLWEIVMVSAHAANSGGNPADLLDPLGKLLAEGSGASRRQQGAAAPPWAMAMALLGRTDEALDVLEPWALAERDRGDILATGLQLGVMSVLLRAARIRDARRWLAMLQASGAAERHVVARAWCGLTDTWLRHERGDAAAAEAAATATLAIPDGRFVLPRHQAATLLARLLTSQGRLEEARDVAAENRRRVELGGAVGLLPDIEALDAELALAAGDSAAACRWADTAVPAFAPDGLRMIDHPVMAQARCWLARGGPGDAIAALRALSALRDHETVTHHRMALSRTLPLLAVAQATAGDDAAAIATMREALAIEPGDLTVRFTEAGAAARFLLASIAADADDEIAERAARLRDANWPREGGALDGDIPLTPREAQILAMMAQWKTNKEIAAELGIATVTARDHGIRLFRKLGVGDRRSAVEAARSAGWLRGGD